MRKALLPVLITAALAGGASAEWVAFSRAPSTHPDLRSAGELETFQIDLTIPGLEVRVVDGYTHLQIPGHVHSMRPGFPELPVVTTSVMLPDSGNARVSLEVLAERELKLDVPVAPSRGHLTRDIPLSSVPRQEGPVYQQAGLYPADSYPASISDPYILRDVRGAAVRLSPVLFDPSTNTLKVLEKARLHVTVDAGALGVNVKQRRRDRVVPQDFLTVYDSLFVNFPQQAFAAADPDERLGRTLILCPDQWVPNLQPLLDWRATKGLDTKVLPMSEVGEGTAAIRAALQAEYEAGGLMHVLFVGDADTIPPLKGDNESADCDACYLMLEGNDYVPDAFHSRFSAKTAEEVDVQVARAVKYEKQPSIGAAAAHYRKAVGIASNEGNPTDYERMEVLRNALKDFRMDEVDRLYDPDSGNYLGLKPVKPEAVIEAVNQGRTVINYMGHGSKTAWVTSNFGVSHIEQLTNDQGQWPMIWSVACVNGDFVHGSDCFGEAWAKAGTAAAPKGAIGIVAASTNMAWVPPTTWQGAIIQEFMIGEKVFTGGALHHYGLVKAMEQWGTDANSEGVQMVEQCIFFGDSSVVLRDDVPHQAAVTMTHAEDGHLELKVAAGEMPCKSARIVLRSGDEVCVRVTDADGKASFPAFHGEAADMAVTVTGHNMIPIVDQPIQ